VKTTVVEIIRTSGAHAHHTIPRDGVIPWVRRMIDAETLDTVNLRDGRVMLVDDNGYEANLVELGPGHFENRVVRALKNDNPEATKLYHAICIPGTTHRIVGDVAIVVDQEVE
jgi:hypothetical protein